MLSLPKTYEWKTSATDPVPVYVQTKQLTDSEKLLVMQQETPVKDNSISTKTKVKVAAANESFDENDWNQTRSVFKNESPKCKKVIVNIHHNISELN